MNREITSTKRAYFWLQPNFFLGFVVLGLVFIMAARTPVDSDTWWHLRVGEQTWQTGQVAQFDEFSYTRMGATWINHSWLGQLILYIAFRYGGYPLLGLLVALLATISMSFVFWQMAGHPLLRGFVLVLAIPVAATAWSPRPQLMSLVFFGIAGYLLYLFKEQHKNRLWLLIPLFIVWSNIHAGYVLGFLLIAATILGQILNQVINHIKIGETSWKEIRLLTIGLVASVFAVLVNPNGIQAWFIPFKTIEVGVLQDFISEWASPDFHQLAQQPFLWLLFTLLAVIGLAHKKLDGSEILVVITFAYMALLARRNFAPFAMVCAPVLSRQLNQVISDWRAIILSNPKTKASIRIVNLIASSNRPNNFVRIIVNAAILFVLGCIAILKIMIVTSPVFVSTLIEMEFPAKAVGWIKQNKPEGRMFNHYNWGGYLLWEVPEHPVFVDGRTDLYSDEILEEWLQVVRADESWQEVLDKWDVRLIILPPEMAVVKQLKAVGWHLSYEDSFAVIYSR